MGFSLDEKALKKIKKIFICVCRTYCETDIDPAHRKLTQLQAVVRYLTGKEPDLECKWAHKCHHPSLLLKHTWLQCLRRSAKHFFFLSGGVLTGDVLLLQQTLFDAVVTAPMEAYWTALMLNTSG